MSDVVMWLMVVVRMVGGKEVCRKVKIPNRSDKLREWCLPMMAEAMAADEKRFEDERRRKNRETLGDSIMELAKRMGAEVVDE